jgi:hypothetical protein
VDIAHHGRGNVCAYVWFTDPAWNPGATAEVHDGYTCPANVKGNTQLSPLNVELKHRTFVTSVSPEYPGAHEQPETDVLPIGLVAPSGHSAHVAPSKKVPTAHVQSAIKLAGKTAYDLGGQLEQAVSPGAANEPPAQATHSRSAHCSQTHGRSGVHTPDPLTHSSELPLLSQTHPGAPDKLDGMLLATALPPPSPTAAAAAVHPASLVTGAHPPR